MRDYKHYFICAVGTLLPCSTESFRSGCTGKVRLDTTFRLNGVSYGRGSEIWPPTNIDGEGFSLGDSFPERKVPQLSSPPSLIPQESKGGMFGSISRINSVIPSAISIALLLRGLVQAIDVLFVVSFSGYVLLMTKSKLLLTLPPQGHGEKMLPPISP